MQLRVLSLGSNNVNRRVADSLTGSQIELICQTDESEAIHQMAKSKFDLALVDGNINDLATTCSRINWICRTPIAMLIEEDQTDWKKLGDLDVDGFISREANKMEMVAHFQTIARRGQERNADVKLLIIEDDEQTRETLKLSFQIYWPEAVVEFASSGQEGINTARMTTFDAVLLDLVLPDISGFDVLTQIRNFSNVPVIILTADHNPENSKRAKKAGANDYILKPFKQVELFSRINQNVKIGAAVN
jgi:DNA-binding response OmpR family regulator